MGDGGSANDPGNRAQNLDTLLGKMLRIDVSGGGAYSIPSSNPFVGISGRDEIWAYGLRNPWRWSFDRWNGDLWIGDVGQDTYEEIDYQPASSHGGQNYGWRCYEGLIHTPGVTSCSPTDTTNPVIAHSQSTTGMCAIIGGFVYRGAEYSNLFGTYLYADECSPNIRTITRNAAGSFVFGNLGTLGGSTLVSFGEDKWGELYVCDYGGTIYKFQGASCSPTAYLSNLDTIHVCGTSYLLKTPAGNGFNYNWSYNGTQIYGAHSSSYLATLPGRYAVTVFNRASCSRTSTSVVLAFDGGCSVTFNLKTFIEGLYAGSGKMNTPLYTSGLSYDSTASDSIIVELRQPVTFNLVASVKTLLHSNGNSQVIFPSSILTHSYYMVVRQRAAIETWSKNPILFNSPVMSFDLTSP